MTPPPTTRGVDPDDIVARTVACDRGRERHGVGDAGAGKVKEEEEDDDRSEGQNCERLRGVELGDGLGVTKAMARVCVVSLWIECVLSNSGAQRLTERFWKGRGWREKKTNCGDRENGLLQR